MDTITRNNRNNILILTECVAMDAYGNAVRTFAVATVAMVIWAVNNAPFSLSKKPNLCASVIQAET